MRKKYVKSNLNQAPKVWIGNSPAFLELAQNPPANHLKQIDASLKQTIKDGAITGALDLLNIITFIKNIDSNFNVEDYKRIFIEKMSKSEEALAKFVINKIHKEQVLLESFSTSQLEQLETILRDFKTIKDDNQHV